MTAFIEEHRGVYGVEPMCKMLQIAQPTYYERSVIARDPERASARAKSDADLCIMVKFRHSGLKALVPTAQAFRGLCSLRATMSLRSRDQIGNCDTRRARQIVWTLKVQHVPFFLGKQRHDRRHRLDQLK